jgi:hypothetical protein
MENVPRHATPTAIYPYFDKIQFWLREPIDRATLRKLRKQCGRGSIFTQNGPARFNAWYRQRVEFKQPSDQALQWLARREDALINRAEITLDLMFKYRANRDEAWEFLNCHLIRRWHGKKQEIRIERGKKKPSVAVARGTIGTRYDAGPWAPNLIALYPEECSRVTGELNCLHLEWRLKGLKAVRLIGIEAGQDLLAFNHRQFWQERLLLVTADKERLGRLINNQRNGRKSRVSRVTQISKNFWINIDKRVGDIQIRSHDTFQELIDQLGPSYRIHRALAPISNEVLLPP